MPCREEAPTPRGGENGRGEEPKPRGIGGVSGRFRGFVGLGVEVRGLLLAGPSRVRTPPQVAESAVSALVQTNFLISALGGIEQIRALELSDDQLQSLALSVAVSCFSLGLGFASRDKADSAVLDLPGKLGWSPSFAALIFARFLEVLSRVVAYSVLQISLRGYPLLRLTGLGAGAFALLAARVAFPEASLADVAAARLGVHAFGVLS